LWNTVLPVSTSSPSRLTETLARRAVERSMADKQSELAEEMQRIVSATYALVERTGNLDPSMREILAHTGLSTQAFYRYFRSKDELMLALLDDGRRRLLEYLEHRMQRADSPGAKVRAWVEGVMAQAADPSAASRTRPFFTDEDRLAEMFPADHRQSVELLVSLLIQPLSELSVGQKDTSSSRAEVRRDAEAAYRLAFATLHEHLLRREKPAKATVDHLIEFVLRGAGGSV
jgi:AcrR family transcriptional regulator